MPFRFSKTFVLTLGILIFPFSWLEAKSFFPTHIGLLSSLIVHEQKAKSFDNIKRKIYLPHLQGRGIYNGLFFLFWEKQLQLKIQKGEMRFNGDASIDLQGALSSNRSNPSSSSKKEPIRFSRNFWDLILTLQRPLGETSPWHLGGGLGFHYQTSVVLDEFDRSPRETFFTHKLIYSMHFSLQYYMPIFKKRVYFFPELDLGLFPFLGKIDSLIFYQLSLQLAFAL